MTMTTDRRMTYLQFRGTAAVALAVAALLLAFALLAASAFGLVTLPEVAPRSAELVNITFGSLTAPSY